MNRLGSTTFENTERQTTLRRSFDAPMSLVFDALTKPEHVVKWFSADPVPLHVCELEFRVGGVYHFAWYAGDTECSFRGTYLEIVRPTLIVATWLFEGWPNDEAVETVHLSEVGGVTTMTDRLEFKDAASFGDHFQGDTQGVQSSFDKLDELLTELQSGRV